MTVKEIIEKIGRERLYESTGASRQKVDHWVRSNKIPSKHYLTIRKLIGVPLKESKTIPQDLFTFEYK